MKTDDLITLMTQDAPVGMRYGRALAIALGAGIGLSALLLIATVGLRHNMASVFETARVLFKIALTLVLAVLAARLAASAGRERRRAVRYSCSLFPPHWSSRPSSRNSLHCQPMPGMQASSAATLFSACSSCRSCRLHPSPACSGR
jgi:hypothetical protein